MPQNKILVIRGGAIGDFILTLPVLAALRKQFPQSRLEVLGYPHIVSLAVMGGLADDVRPIESRALAGFFARAGQLDELLQEYFASFAIVLSFLYDPDGIFQANVARCSRAQFIVGPHRPDDRAGIHATDVFLQPLERLAIFDTDPIPQLSVDSPPAASRQLALHPGSGSERKNWPEAQWSELIRALVAETTWPLLLVGGEAEGERLHRLARGLPSGRCEVFSCQPLPDVARRLAACAGFVGHDSGISHLAAAVGLPGLALWGDTPVTVWRPRSESFQVVAALGTGVVLGVREVMAEIENLRRR